VNDGTRPISSGVQATVLARLGVFLFFASFFVAGAAFGIEVFGKPLLNMFSARQWRSASCEILSSRVQHRSSEDGASYRVDVT
jgi:hypothetical protein